MVGVPEEFIANIWHRINIYRANRISEQTPYTGGAVSARTGGPYKKQILLFPEVFLHSFSINFIHI